MYIKKKCQVIKPSAKKALLIGNYIIIIFKADYRKFNGLWFVTFLFISSLAFNTYFLLRPSKN
jgi:membrane-bound acyltransferase YfiQ involved in biofilm formation